LLEKEYAIPGVNLLSQERWLSHPLDENSNPIEGV
jgi:hypothetical protein